MLSDIDTFLTDNKIHIFSDNSSDNTIIIVIITVDKFAIWHLAKPRGKMAAGSHKNCSHYKTYFLLLTYLLILLFLLSL